MEETAFELAVVLAADDHFSAQLATAARSVVDALKGGRRLVLHLLDMGISTANRDRVDESLDDHRVKVRWFGGLAERVAALPQTIRTISRATYGRLLIPELLPDVPRVVYLDADVVAKRCVGDLFSTDMEGNAAMAVQDAEAPFVSSPSAVPFWYERGRRADDPNFNCGVMLLDLDAWRTEGVGETALEYLIGGGHHFAQDQEAINSVMPGRIGKVDPRWNQQTELFRPMVEAIQPYPKDQITLTQSDPWIIHFCNGPKPWVFGCEHPLVDEWFDALDRTAFAGWRPQGPTATQRVVKRGIATARRTGRRVGLLPAVDDD